MRLFCATILAVIIVSGITAQTHAQSDTTFTYQGTLNDASGPVNGVYSIIFYLYDAPTDGTQIGVAFNNSSLTVTDGLFTAELDFGAEVFDNTGRWLEIYVNSNLLAPRQPITRSPYSIQTRGIFVDTNNNVGIGTTTPADRLHIRGDFPAVRLQDNLAVSSYSEITDGGTGQLRIDKTNSSGAVFLDLNPKPVNGTSDATIRFFRDTLSTGNKAVQFLRGNSSSEISAQIGVDGEDSFFQTNGGDIGIGTSTPTAKLHVVSSSTGIAGIYAEVSAGNSAISGLNSSSANYTTGVSGSAAANFGYGVKGIATGLDAHGVFGWAHEDAPYAVFGQCDSNFGYGVYGTSRATTGTNYGVYGRSLSETGRGTYGYASNITGVNYGVVGRSNSTSGFDFYASGAGTNYGASSSRRWKNNIRNIENPLDKIAQLRGVYYDWDEEHGGSHDVGMIAEEVGMVLPEIVNYEENGIDAIGMDYSKMTPLLVEAVNALNELHETEITRKNAQIAGLAERIARLESLIEQSATTQKQETTR